MQSTARTADEYIKSLPVENISAMTELRRVIKENLPKGFEEEMSYGMITYIVPHSIYPAGYHCDIKQALPFLSLASQKNFIAVYHLGLYADQSLLNWFVEEYGKHCKTKLDMGKSCIRFKKLDQIPVQLIGELASKITVEDWIKVYEREIKK